MMAFALFACAISCTPDPPEAPAPEPGPTDSDKVSVLAVLQNGREWNEGDEVLINGATYAVVAGGASSTTIENVKKAEKYCAAYDFGSGTCTKNVLSFTLPQEQSTNIAAIAPMVASSTEPNLSFKHLMGTLRLSIAGEGVISKVIIIAEENIAGTAEINLDFVGQPSLSFLEGSKMVSLSLGNGASLPLDVDFAIPAKSYANGFTVTIYGKENEIMSTTVEGVEVFGGEVAELDEAITYAPSADIETLYCTATLENDAEGNVNTWNENSVLYVNGVPAYVADATKGEFGPIEKADVYYVSTSSEAATTFSGSVLGVKIPAKQTPTSSLFALNPAVAKSTTNEFQLTYLAGILNVKVSGLYLLNKVTLTSKGNARIAGEGVVDMSTDTPRLAMNNASSKSIEYAAQGLDIANGAELRFVIPAANYTDGFNLTLESSTGETYTFELGAVEVKRNEVALHSDEIVWESAQNDANDLSKYGCANCYMVHAPGEYTFRTRRVDNSNISNIAKVDWLWVSTVEGQSGNVLVSEVSYADGIVTFTASEHEGNALLAAFDEAGNIVWSWHIWLTDKPEVYDYQNNPIPQSGGLTDGFYCMDRNLGATDATALGGYETFGLYYQWGRKDPFIGDKQEERVQEYVKNNGRYEWVEKVKPFGNSSSLTVCNTAYTQAQWVSTPTNAEIGTIAYATANPMTFLYSGTGAVANWLNVKGLTEEEKDAICYDPDKSLWRPFQKSNSDPCPVGYQVPRKAMWVYLDSANSVYGDDGFVNTTSAGAEVWYPSAGCRSAHPSETGSLIKVQKSTGFAYLWASELQVSEMSFHFYYHAPMFDAIQSAGWGNGYNVRCVKAY